MKNILLLLIIFPFLSYSQQECIGDNSTDPCCNEIIRTDPINANFANSNDRPYPFINPTGYLKNTFNWLTPSFSFPNFTGTVTNPFAQPTLSKYKMLNNNLGNMTIQEYLAQSPYHPKYGWELITANHNIDMYPDPSAEQMNNVSGPTIVLYNKYLSKLLILASPGSSTNYDKTIFNLGFNFDNSNQVKTLNSYTSCLFNNYSKSQALDKLLEIKEIQIPAAPAGQLEWAIGEAPISYDPCVCQYPGKMKIEAYAYSTSAVKLEGRAIGTSVQFDNSGNPPLQNGRDWLNSVWTIDEKDPNSNNFNWVVKGGVQTYNNIDKMAEKYKQDPLWTAVANLLNTGASLPGLGGIKVGIGNTLDDLITGLAPNFVQKLIDSQARSEIKNTKVNVGQIMSGGSSFFSMLKGGGTPNASILELEVQLQGKIYSKQKMTGIHDIEFFTPGSLLANRPNASWTRYPMYNEAMGIFALLKKPSVTYDIAYHRLNGVKTISDFFIKFNEPIRYAINPAADINLSKSKIDVNLEFYGTLINNFNCCGNPVCPELSLSLPTNSQIMDSLRIKMEPEFTLIILYKSLNEDTVSFKVISKSIPIDNIHNVYFHKKINQAVSYVKSLQLGYGEGGQPTPCNPNATIDFTFPLNSNFKITCDLEHKPNAYGISNKSLHVFNYEFDFNKIDAFDYENVIGYNDICNCAQIVEVIPTNIKNNVVSPSSLNLALIRDITLKPIIGNELFYTSNQVIYCNNLNINNIKLYTLPGVQVTYIVYGSATISDAEISPDIHIVIAKSPYLDDLLTPISNLEIKQFCNKNNQIKYRANEPLKTSLRPNKHDFVTLLPTSISLHPNPAIDIVNIELAGYQNTNASIKIFDIAGREVLEHLEKNISSEKHTFPINTFSLQNGTYIVKVWNGIEEKTTKLIIVKQ